MLNLATSYFSVLRILRVPVVLLTLVWFLGGCNIARQSSPSHFYLLDTLSTDEAPAGAAAHAIRAGLGQVQIPAYLDRPQIVSRLPGNQLAYAEFHRWGEPMAAGMSRVLRANLSQLTGSTEISAYPWHQDYPRDYNVFPVILAFEPNDARGEAVLKAVYRVARAAGKRETLAIVEAEHRAPLARSEPEYEAKVRALSQTLAALSRDIAATLAAIHGSED